MEDLFKQIRIKFADQEQPQSIRGPRVPAQNSPSFKREKKGQNWYRRQLTSRMSSPGEDSDRGIEFETAIAAAAFAITKLDESGSPNQTKSGERLETGTSQTRAKSRKEGMDEPPDSGRISRWFADNKQSAGEASRRKPEATGQKIPEKVEEITPMTTGKYPTMGRTPTMVKTPTSTDKDHSDVRIIKQGSIKDTKLGEGVADSRSTGKQLISKSEGGKGEEILMVSGNIDAKADAWEKTKMAKIKKRYEKTNATILSWEDKNKAKSERHFRRIERKLELRRARASQEYREEISRIDHIATGAKALALERKMNDESKVKDVLKKIRLTGKVPATCFCF